jgi:hypothetical protein
MESNWGIRITGRLMKHKPWPVDCNNNYSEPGLYEREEIYGISGKAVKETLLYFEKCGGDVNGMIELLNNHAINRNFRVTNETLLDDSRWYTNEFYFYFIMFTKELMNNYDWRFVSANKEELSKYHKIYEI